MESIRSYSILHKIETGELVSVGIRGDLAQAERLVSSLKELWPAEYVIRSMSANDAVEERQEANP